MLQDVIGYSYFPDKPENKRLNFQVTTKSYEPEKFKGWVLGISVKP